MKTPHHWYDASFKCRLISQLLWPFGKLYEYATACRLKSKTAVKYPAPVICVGNLNAGGTGKTPTVIALVEAANSLGLSPVIVSKGYKGRATSPMQVDPSKHTADLCGDEPLLLANFAPTIVTPRRDLANGLIETLAPDIVILDDGFQDPSVFKTYSLIVVDAETGFGNGLCIPAGPLREPVDVGLSRADACLSIGNQTSQERVSDAQITVPRIRAELSPLQTGMDWDGAPCVAFAGIGRPEKFFDTLRLLGAKLIHCEALPDHGAISSSLFMRLKRLALSHQAQFVTTEKDAARLPRTLQSEVLALPVRLHADEPNAFQEIIKTALTHHDELQRIASASPLLR